MSDVLNPNHYKGKDGLEAIDVIIQYQLCFRLGNVVKYLIRAGKKPGEDRIKDLSKAAWLLNHIINMPQEFPFDQDHFPEIKTRDLGEIFDLSAGIHMILEKVLRYRMTYASETLMDALAKLRSGIIRLQKEAKSKAKEEAA